MIAVDVRKVSRDEGAPAAALRDWGVRPGVLDCDPWQGRLPALDQPVGLRVDLAPTPDASWDDVRQVALVAGAVLHDHGLIGYPKTSGSDGIHVLVPIERRYSYGQTRDFSAVVAGAIAQAHPGLAPPKWGKSQRRGGLDAPDQKGQGKTSASA